MLALLPTACSLLALAAPPVITPAEAAQHVGKEVIVQGKVEQVVTTLNLTTHVNFGGRYPDQLFTGKIFKAQQGLFAGVKAFEGKLAQVQGVVRVYRGKPEIGLDEPSQLRLVEPTPASPPAPLGQGEPPAPTIGEPSFDARGADFAGWIAHFRNAVGLAWRPPDAATAGQSRVGVEFVVERDGRVSAARVRESSGNPSIDLSAATAVQTARLLPLPDAYPDPNAMMRVDLVH
jgi:TonB family protein